MKPSALEQTERVSGKKKPSKAKTCSVTKPMDHLLLPSPSCFLRPSPSCFLLWREILSKKAFSLGSGTNRKLCLCVWEYLVAVLAGVWVWRCGLWLRWRPALGISITGGTTANLFRRRRPLKWEGNRKHFQRSIIYFQPSIWAWQIYFDRYLLLSLLM